MIKSQAQSNRRWTRAKNETPRISGLQVSNEQVCLPVNDDILFRDDFCTETERLQILADIEEREYKTEGFHRRIRVQRYTLDVDNGAGEDDDAVSECPNTLKRLASRVQSEVLGTDALPPTHILVEEHQTSPWSYSGDYAPDQMVATFETRTDDRDNAEYFVALVVIRHEIVYHINKPNERHELMWKLETVDHHTNCLLKQGSVLLKTGDFLRNWRSFTTSAPGKATDRGDDEDALTALIIKFSRIPQCTRSGRVQANDQDFGYIMTDEDRIPRSGEMPPLAELLTVVVTTSPIKSHPSTELLERTFSTFHLAGSDFMTCQKVIVCDGYRKQDDGQVSKKHANSKQAMRNGIVNDDQANNYVVFKERLKKLCLESNSESPFWNTSVEELSERMGYGFALRHALRHCVTTQFVCVIQHDRSFLRPTPVYDVVHTMWRHRPIKYVGMSMRSNHMYRDIFQAKYGKASEMEMRTMVRRPPELLLDANQYGPSEEMFQSIEGIDEKVMKGIRSVAEAYRMSAQYLEERKWSQAHPPPEGKHQLTLTPTLFWYDNTHVCETAHYRDFVFHPLYKMVARGGFVEDKLSPVMKRTVERLGLQEGHARFGCFILDDHSGLYFTGHLDGGSYVTKDDRRTLKDSYG